MVKSYYIIVLLLLLVLVLVLLLLFRRMVLKITNQFCARVHSLDFIALLGEENLNSV